jgi:hypothetical protein
MPLRVSMAGFHKFTVDQYHRLIETGFVTEDDNLELLEGYLIPKMSKNPPHEGCIDAANALLNAIKPPGWIVRIQQSLTLSDSEPEPDLLLARGTGRSYFTRHPGPSDTGLVIEVADSSLASDRTDKVRIYARAGIVCYWIVNVVDGQVEVYTAPSGPTSAPTYSQRQDYLPGSTVPLILDGKQIASIAVQDLLP